MRLKPLVHPSIWQIQGLLLLCTRRWLLRCVELVNRLAQPGCGQQKGRGLT